MSGEVYKNKELKKYFQKYIKTMNVEDKYKPMIVDILLRRADTFNLSPEDIRQDVVSLLYNLEGISVQEMPKGYENAWGVYIPWDKEVLVSESLINSNEDDRKKYQTITHEVYHALSRDENGNDRLARYNSITGQYNSSLLEAIVEKSSYRAVFGNDRQNNAYYNNSARGYGDITFIVDVLEATYGVTEKEFLKNGIMGRERLAEFLSTRSGETPDSAYMFLDAIESNYALLHKSLYPFGEEELDPYQRSLNMKSALTGIYNLCETKMAERINRSSIHSFEEMSNFNDELKYDHNKLYVIMDERLSYFSQNYDYSLRDEVHRGVHQNRQNTLLKINDIDSLVNSAPNFRDSQNLLNAYEWAKMGNLSSLPKEARNFYNINLKFDQILPITQETINKAFYDEEFGTQYDNSKIPQLFKKFKQKDNIFKSSINKIKNIFSRNNQKLLTVGEASMTPQQEEKIEPIEQTSIFPELTKDKQEYYNNQVKKAVDNLNKNKSQDDIYRNIEDEEK